MYLDSLKFDNKRIKTDELNKAKKEKEKEKDEKEVLNFIETNIIYEKLLINIADIKTSKDPKEKIEKIKDSFTEDGMIIYQDSTWLVQEIKDIKGFLYKIAKWEISIDFSIDIEQYVDEWAIALEKKKKDGIDYIKIKKVQLNSDYLDGNAG